MGGLFRFLGAGAFLVAGAIVTLDSPLAIVVHVLGDKGAAASRQPLSSLQIAIDLNARREGRRVAVLVQDWLYCYPKTGEVFLVPRTYETDFASIPQPAQWMVNPFGNHAEAAVIHDWLYAVGEEKARPKADDIFRYAMKEGGVNVVRRNMMHRAARIGGNKPYGATEEWRFRDPLTLFDVDPPFQKPAGAAIATIDCSELEREAPQLILRYWSNLRSAEN